MNPILEDLIDLLTLEELDTNLFRGQSRDIVPCYRAHLSQDWN